VEGNGELDHPEAGAEMAAGDRHRIDGFLAQLIGKLAQLPALEPAQIRRRLDQVEKWGSGGLGHWEDSTERSGQPIVLLGL
jgi:hypothetical protein